MARRRALHSDPRPIASAMENNLNNSSCVPPPGCRLTQPYQPVTIVPQILDNLGDLKYTLPSAEQDLYNPTRPPRGRSADVTLRVPPSSRQKAGHKPRRSPAPRNAPRNVDEDDDEPETPRENDGIEDRYEYIPVGDRDKITEIYRTRLSLMLQLTLKKILKLWIKAVHPKKQSLHPYNGGIRTKPEWWPEDVKHTEPDHMSKAGRLELALHIVRYPRFRAGTLRQSTIDIASSLEPRFREIVPRLLNEIYDLREQEERLERGEIDPSTNVCAPVREQLKPKAPKPTGSRKRGGTENGGGSTKRRRVSPAPMNLDSQRANLSSGYDDNLIVDEPPPDRVLASSAMPNYDFGDARINSNEHLAGSFTNTFGGNALSTAIGDNHNFQMADNPQSGYDLRGASMPFDCQGPAWGIYGVPSGATDSGQSFPRSPTWHDVDDNFGGSAFQGPGG